jgi:hypothetical protein
MNATNPAIPSQFQKCNVILNSVKDLVMTRSFTLFRMTLPMNWQWKKLPFATQPATRKMFSSSPACFNHRS